MGVLSEQSQRLPVAEGRITTGLRQLSKIIFQVLSFDAGPEMVLDSKVCRALES